MSKDDNGHGLLHKAVYYGQRELVDYLLEKYPETLEVKDWVSLFFYKVAVYSLLKMYILCIYYKALWWTAKPSQGIYEKTIPPSFIAYFI